MALFLAFLAALAPAFDGGAASKPAPTTITLRAKAVVRGTEFQLSEMADLSGPLAAEAGAVRVGYTPSPGRERLVSAESVQLKLAGAGLPKDRFAIVGKQSLVKVATHTIGGRELAGRVEALVRPQLTADAKLEIRGEPNEWVLPVPRSEGPIEVQLVSNPKTIRGDGSVEVRAVCGEETLGSSAVAVRVRYEAEVFVACASLLKGDPAEGISVERKRVDITTLSGEPIRDAAILHGRVLARAIPKDAILTTADLAQAPVFRKGDQTRIVVKRGALRIEALVRLEADAVIGAQVPVTCLEFGKTLLARVADDGTLSIDNTAKTKE